MNDPIGLYLQAKDPKAAIDHHKGDVDGDGRLTSDDEGAAPRRGKADQSRRSRSSASSSKIGTRM